MRILIRAENVEHKFSTWESRRIHVHVNFRILTLKHLKLIKNLSQISPFFSNEKVFCIYLHFLYSQLSLFLYIWTGKIDFSIFCKYKKYSLKKFGVQFFGVETIELEL